MSRKQIHDAFGVKASATRHVLPNAQVISGEAMGEHGVVEIQLSCDLRAAQSNWTQGAKAIRATHEPDVHPVRGQPFVELRAVE